MRWLLSYIIPLGVAAIIWPISHSVSIGVEVGLTIIVLAGGRAGQRS